MDVHHIVVLFAIYSQAVLGGICWFSRTRRDKCKHVYSLRMSRGQCCDLPFASVSWSPHENVSRTDIIYWMLFSGGAPQCTACHKTCDKVKCWPNRKCRIRRGQARCVCSPYCPRYMKMYGAVCGTDRQTYKNYCAMLRHNCRRNTEVRLSYYGSCTDSCRKVKCFNPKHHCLLDQDGLPHCVHCNTVCPDVTTAVLCGEDGVTYRSYCHLVAAVCMKGRAIRIAYKGQCRDDLNCSTLQCAHGFKCLVNPISNRPQCTTCQTGCNAQTPPGDKQLCGTDGVTYNDYCTMQETSCDKGIVIKTQHYGKCRDTDIFRETQVSSEMSSWSNIT